MQTLGAQVRNLYSLNPMCKPVRLIWNEIDWNKVQSSVHKIQYKISKARLSGNIKQVHSLQNVLVNHFGAKLLAVRRVTTLNKGKKTTGVDKLVITTPEDKLRLARVLKLDGRSQPIRRVWVPKPGKTEKRPLGIPVIQDRAKQALAKLALEPEWEAVFEPNSYGFRPGRKAHDAVEAIFKNLHFDTPKWIFDADIKKCFDTIDHEALLSKVSTFPAMRKQIAAWLKAGIMEGYSNRNDDVVTPTSAGTPQGGIISPLLANIALHGLEFHLKEFVGKLPIKPHPGASRGVKPKQTALGVIRFADDFVLIHRNKEILELCIAEARIWLARIGLLISEEKSVLRDAREGFVFLGFQIIMVKKPKLNKYKVKITPSRANQQKVLTKIKEIIDRNKAKSSYLLISLLNPIIVGWANYFRFCECKDVFSKMTHFIFQKIRSWVFRRDKRNGRFVVKEKYFPSNRTYDYCGVKHKDNWVLVGKDKDKNGILKENRLVHMVWVPSLNYVKVKGTHSPFDGDHLYWTEHSSKHSHFPTKISKLLRSQKGYCKICKVRFTIFDADSWEIDHIIPRSKGGKDSYVNLQLVHGHCHAIKTSKERSHGELCSP
jgi:RNA-directed DNA polymerase